MIIKNPQNWYLACFNSLAFAPITVFTGLWGAPFMETEFNLTHNQSMDSVSFLILGFAIGAPLFGFLSDKIQRRKIILFIGALGSFLLFIGVLYWPDLNMIQGNLLVFCFGFVNSTVMISFAIVHEINSTMITGTVMGFMFTLQALLVAFNDPLIGYLSQTVFINRSNGLLQALNLLPIYLAIACILLVFIKETHCKPTQLNEEAL